MEKFKVFICYGGRFEYINGMPMYMPIECTRVPLKLPVAPEKPMTCKVLLKNVFKKLGLPLDTPVCMKYKVDQYVIDITDDVDDFGDFLCHAINNAPIEIYLVDIVRKTSGMGSNQPSSSSSGFQPQYQSFQQPFQQPFQPQYQSCQPPFQQFSFPYQPQYQFHYHAPPQDTTNNAYPIQHTQDTSFKVVECHEEPGSHPNEDYYHYDEENVNPPKDHDNPFKNHIVTSDEEEDEPDPRDTYDKPIPTQAAEKDIFWKIPSPLGGEEEEEEEEEEVKKRPTTMYETSCRIRQGQTFESKDEFLLQLHTKCLEEGFQIQPKKSDRKRYTAKCILPDCDWKISALCVKDCNNFQVRKLHDAHTCSRAQILSNSRHASKKVLGNLLMEAMTSEGRIYKGKEIVADMTQRFKISLTYNQAWRAKCHAIELLRGTPAESFQKLPIYLHNLKLYNPGSVTNLLTDAEGKFVMCYMSIGAAIRSFVNHTRPIIIVDGAHLKGGYLGTNLIAVAMDGNNGILPLAYGIGAGETSDVWRWFFGNLRDALESAGGIDNLTFISDRAPAIADGISAVFPEAFHALCCRHLLMNLRSKSSKVKHFEWHYWKMCKAYRKSDFDHHFGVMSRHLPASATVLTAVGKERWSRHHSTKTRYAYLTTNSAESINALSKHARKLPVTMLLEFFRSSVQQWYFKHRNTAAKVKTPLTPYAEHKIGKRVGKSLSWTVKPSTNMICEVVDRKKNGTVNLEARTCTCNQWQLSGLPCGHVAAVSRYFKMDSVMCFAERYFTTETYQAAYSEAINPMPHPSEWTDPGNLQICLTPILKKRQSGRPPGRARIPSKGEEKQKYKNHCSRCKEQGHSRVNCMAPYDRTDEPSQSRSTSRAKSRSKKKTSTKSMKNNFEDEAEHSQPTHTFSSVHLSDP